MVRTLLNAALMATTVLGTQLASPSDAEARCFARRCRPCVCYYTVRCCQPPVDPCRSCRGDTFAEASLGGPWEIVTGQQGTFFIFEGGESVFWVPEDEDVRNIGYDQWDSYEVKLRE